MSLGEFIADARRKASLSQKALAAQVKKRDGRGISPQYLNDIEHDRRTVPIHLIEQLALALQVPADLLYYWAGALPRDVRGRDATAAIILAAFQAFRRELRKVGGDSGENA